MGDLLPRSVHRPIPTPFGAGIGISNRWQAGQYCAILTRLGIVGCGIYDIPTCDEFQLAVAIARGTPEKPLVEPEDLLPAKIVRASRRAQEFGVREGMTGREALEVLLRAEAPAS